MRFLAASCVCFAVITWGLLVGNNQYIPAVGLQIYSVLTLLMAFVGCALIESRELWIRLVRIPLGWLRRFCASGWIFSTVWTAMFLCAVAGARSFDLLGNDFFTSGPRLLLFNSSRLAFIVFLGFALYQLGWLILKGVSKKSSFDFPGFGDQPLAGVVACLLCGGSAATLFLFGVGLLNGYRFWFLLLVSAPLVWWSARWVGASVDWCIDCLGVLMRRAQPRRYFTAVLLLSMCLLGVFFTLVSKALWVGGAGGDVYTHYLPYYREVISHGGLAPNDVWYHYYVSKGVTLNFLAMLLSDGLGAQLVTTLFHLASAAIVFLLGVRLLRSRAFAGLASGIFLFVFIAPEHWSIFLKHHEMLLTWTIFGLLFALSSFHARRQDLAAMCLLGLMLGAAYAVQFPTACALFAAVLGIAFVAQMVLKNWNSSTILGVTGIANIVALLLLLLFNQLSTGLALETPLRLFWKLADVGFFSQWVSPYLVIYLLEGSSAGVGEVASPLARLGNYDWFGDLFRIKELKTIYFSPWLLLFFASLVTISSLVWGRKSGLCRSTGFLLLLLAAVGWVLANVINQPASVHRMFTFLVPVSILIGLLIWVAGLRVLSCGIPRAFGRKVVVALVVFAATLTPVGVGSRAEPMLSFSLGAKSAKDALQAVPSLDPSVNTKGETWVPYLESREFLGPDQKMLCFNVLGNVFGTSYSFPGKGMESEVSFSLGPGWHLICFGDAQTSLEELKNQKIDYFMVDWAHQWLFGGVPFSELFSKREIISSTLGVVDLWPGVWLLTWKPNATRPLTEEELTVWELISGGYPAIGAKESFGARLKLRISSGLAAKGVSARSKMNEIFAIVPEVTAIIRSELGLSNSAVMLLTKDWEDEVARWLTVPDNQSRSHNFSTLSKLVIQLTQSSSIRLIERYWLRAGGAQYNTPRGAHQVHMFPEELVVNNAIINIQMKDLANVTREIYDYNKGRLDSIERPERLREAYGWQ